MTEPRRPDDARLSTADVAAATDRATERDVTRESRVGHGDAVVDVTRQTQPDREPSAPLFARDESDDFHRRWTDIQAGFVDEPRQAVANADGLVAEAIKRLAEIFARERGSLEQQWAQGADVSTEDLRVALQRYRSFFDRLLSV